MSRVDTIRYGSVAEYATVPARLKKFRETHPRASITTVPTFLDDGSCVFVATIISDLSDESSARATGSARYTATEISKSKAFEKLETIATGRALSLLGFLNNGDIASSEEMLEFEQHKENRVLEAVEAVKRAKDRSELMAIQASLPAEDQKQLNDHIRNRVKELTSAVTN
jgi:hypothetical protein